MKNDKEIIKWVIKEIIGYQHNLIDLDDLQATLLHSAELISNSEYGAKIKIIFGNCENKLEELKFTYNNSDIVNRTQNFLKETEQTLWKEIK